MMKNLLLLILSLMATAESAQYFRQMNRTYDPELARTMEILKNTGYASFLVLKFHLTCSRPFCVFINVLESDTVGDEVMKTKHASCTETNEMAFEETVAFWGGDGMFDSHYEPVIEIFSDCRETADNTRYLKTVNLPILKDYNVVRAHLIKENLDNSSESFSHWTKLRYADGRRLRYRKKNKINRHGDSADWMSWGKNITDREWVFKELEQCLCYSERTIRLEDCPV